MQYKITFANGSSASTTLKADSIKFEDGFVKFYCSGSTALEAAWPLTFVSEIKKVEE